MVNLLCVTLCVIFMQILGADAWSWGTTRRPRWSTRAPEVTWPAKGPIYYPPGTKDHSAPRCIEVGGRRLCFRGSWVFMQTMCPACSKTTKSFEECVQFVRDQSEEEGCIATSLLYSWGDGSCMCFEGKGLYMRSTSDRLYYSLVY